MFVIDCLFMYAIKLWTMRLEHQTEASGGGTGLSAGLLIATFIDVATDGFIIGAGFSAGRQTGTILALGISVEGYCQLVEARPRKGCRRCISERHMDRIPIRLDA